AGPTRAARSWRRASRCPAKRRMECPRKRASGRPRGRPDRSIASSSTCGPGAASRPDSQASMYGLIMTAPPYHSGRALLAKGRKKGGKRPQRRRSTPLSGHKRHKRTLSPPLMTLGGISPVSYHRDFLLDLLWVAAMFDTGGGWDAVYEPL